MNHGFNRWEQASRDATAGHDARSLADVAEHEARRRRDETPAWWLAVVWGLISLSAAIMIIAVTQVWGLVVRMLG